MQACFLAKVLLPLVGVLLKVRGIGVVSEAADSCPDFLAKQDFMHKHKQHTGVCRSCFSA